MKKLSAIFLTRTLSALLLCFFVANASAQSTDTTITVALAGKPIAVTLRVPPGWQADTKNAHRFASSIIFYRNIKEARDGGAVIQLSLYQKVDDDTEYDLAYETGNLLRDNKGAQKEKLIIRHPRYKTYSAAVVQQGAFAHYFSFINCGKGCGHGTNVVLKLTHPATPDELAAFRQIISSIQYL